MCVQLLRQPLPESVALPASAELFFLYVVKRAVRDHTATSLSSVYDLLTGACKTLPGLLPQHDWHRLETELTTIVRSSKTIQDQSLSLLCLGVICALTTSSSTSEHDQASNGASQELCSFFTGSKAHKALSLASLQAAWTTKSACSQSRTDIHRSLDIVLDVFNAVGIESTTNWIETAEGKSAISRLVSRCQDKQLDINIRLKVTEASIVATCRLLTKHSFSRLSPKSLAPILVPKHLLHNSKALCRIRIVSKRMPYVSAAL